MRDIGENALLTVKTQVFDILFRLNAIGLGEGRDFRLFQG
jgi:hypothetical protein